MILPNGSEIGEKLTFISELNFPLIEKWGPRESGVRAAAEAGPETTTFDCVGEGTRSTNSATKRNCQNNQPVTPLCACNQLSDGRRRAKGDSGDKNKKSTKFNTASAPWMQGLEDA